LNSYYGGAADLSPTLIKYFILVKGFDNENTLLLLCYGERLNDAKLSFYIYIDNLLTKYIKDFLGEGFYASSIVSST